MLLQDSTYHEVVRKT